MTETTVNFSFSYSHFLFVGQKIGCSVNEGDDEEEHRPYAQFLQAQLPYATFPAKYQSEEIQWWSWCYIQIVRYRHPNLIWNMYHFIKIYTLRPNKSDTSNSIFLTPITPWLWVQFPIKTITFDSCNKKSDILHCNNENLKVVQWLGKVRSDFFQVRQIFSLFSPKTAKASFP